MGRSIDAVGFEAFSVHLDIEQDIIVQQMIAVTSYNGGIGVVSVHSSQPSWITILLDTHG